MTARLPVRPLIDAAAPTILGASRTLGVHPRQLHRWLHYGIRPHDADRLAVTRVGVHPAVLWGDLWWTSALLEDAPVEEAVA